jgi:hypothetical protein
MTGFIRYRLVVLKARVEVMIWPLLFIFIEAVPTSVFFQFTATHRISISTLPHGRISHSVKDGNDNYLQVLHYEEDL